MRHKKEKKKIRIHIESTIYGLFKELAQYQLLNNKIQAKKNLYIQKHVPGQEHKCTHLLLQMVRISRNE